MFFYLVLRQLILFSIHQQNGRYQVRRSVRLGLEPTVMGHTSSDRSDWLLIFQERTICQQAFFSRLFTLCQLVIVKQGISEVVPMLVNLENRFILTFKNSKLPMFCSLKFHRQAESTDALSLSWKGRYVYAFPPHLILNRVLKKVEQEEVTMILIALTWTRREWYPLLLDLHIEVPLRLLEVRDLVSQQYHTRFHHNPAKLQLVAWMIRGISSLPQDFSCRLLRFYFQPEVRKQTRFTTLAGSILPNGANQRISIPLGQLLLWF